MAAISNDYDSGGAMPAAFIAEQIVSVLGEQLLLNFPLNKERLEREIGDKVAAGRPIDMLLPAFPCKSINMDKVLGPLPDIAEYLCLRKLARAVRDMEAIYATGANVTIFSDYHTFAKYIGVGSAAYRQYHNGLETLIDHLGAKDIIRIVNFSTHQEFQAEFRDDFEYQTVLESRYGDPDYASKLDAQIESDENLLQRYKGMKKFVEQDQEPLIRKLSKKSKARTLSQMVKGMMVSGQALDSFLKKNYPGVIRLSIHCYENEGPKSSISLLEDNTVKTPWHNTILFEATTGKFHTDKRSSLLERQGAILMTTFKGQDWMLLQLHADTAMASKLKFVKATLQKEAFGLILESPEGLLDVRDIHEADLTHLIKEFGFVVFRGFKKCPSHTQLEEWYCTRGEPVPWSFGSTEVVKVLPSKPSIVTSNEGLPLHFDLMFPPAYMGVDQSRHAYEDFIPREFLLYCHKQSSKGEGVSLIVDTNLAALMVDGQRRESYRKTDLSYFMRKTHFGGKSFEFTLLHHCPWTGHDTFRWGEIWDEDNHQGTMQTQKYKVVRSPSGLSPKKLEREICKYLKDDRVTVQLNFEDGDYVVLNNYSTVHGRTGFSGEARELWRVQLSPPSDNVPWLQPETATKIGDTLADAKGRV